VTLKSNIQFSVIAHAAWAPGLETEADWRVWPNNEIAITGNNEPAVKAMPALLRRRASVPGKMALEVAYRCLGQRTQIPTIFSSRHGECGRSVDLLTDLARDIPISPASFSLSVHNATAGLFSIARHDHSNSLALAAGDSTIEHALIEACGLLADGEPAVLVVAYDNPPPAIFSTFADCNEQPFAWAWLIEPPRDNPISLTWSAQNTPFLPIENEPAGLEILRFFIREETNLERTSNGQHWQWTRHV